MQYDESSLPLLSLGRDLPLGGDPCATVHGTLLLRGGRADPLQETMHMEDMATFAPYEWTIITWYLTRRAATFVWHATYTADITFTVSLVVIRVSGVPSPLRNGVPRLDFDLHRLTE